MTSIDPTSVLAALSITCAVGITARLLRLDCTAQVGEARPLPASVVCLVCRLEGRALDSAAEAEFLAGVHNELHHGARPVAAPRRLGPMDTGGAA